jgi:predicted aldo/keto reductase-like oxidoreductase
MLQLDKIEQAIKAVEACCGHCEICSPTCPIAISRRALTGLRDDLLEAHNISPEPK